MSEIIKRVTREPAALLGLVTATVGLVILFGVDLTEAQTAGILTFVGALVVLLRFLVTPSSEVAAQELPSGEVVAGPASAVVDGLPVNVTPAPRPLGL